MADMLKVDPNDEKSGLAAIDVGTSMHAWSNAWNAAYDLGDKRWFWAIPDVTCLETANERHAGG